MKLVVGYAGLAMLAVLLTACSGSLRVTSAEVDDAAAIERASSFHIKPVTYEFQRPADWEIPDNDWPTKTREWSDHFGKRATDSERPVYALGPGAEPKEGAVVEFVVTEMKLGYYAFFAAGPARIWGRLTITDAKTGKVIFKGAVDSPGSTEGSDRYSYEGRVKTAHTPVADDVRWLIRRKQ